MPFYHRKPYTKKPKATRYRKRKATYVTKAKPQYSRRRNIAPRNVRGLKSTIQRGQLPFGRSFMARLPYVENYAITASGTTGLAALTYNFYTNNTYDPRYEAGGHQPMQYDFLAQAYERVWVHGVKVELTFSNPTYDGMYVGYRVRANTNTVGISGQTLDYVQEMRDSHISPLNNTGSQTKKYTFFISNPALFGLTKSQYRNIEYSHTTTGNPGAYGLIEPFAFHTISGENSLIRVNIRLTYYCQFTNPITVAQS